MLVVDLKRAFYCFHSVFLLFRRYSLPILLTIPSCHDALAFDTVEQLKQRICDADLVPMSATPLLDLHPGESDAAPLVCDNNSVLGSVPVFENRLISVRLRRKEVVCLSVANLCMYPTEMARSPTLHFHVVPSGRVCIDSHRSVSMPCSSLARPDLFASQPLRCSVLCELHFSSPSISTCRLLCISSLATMKSL